MNNVRLIMGCIITLAGHMILLGLIDFGEPPEDVAKLFLYGFGIFAIAFGAALIWQVGERYDG